MQKAMKKNLKSTLSPSKYLSLKYLYLIRMQHCCFPETGKDYNPGEVHSLILWKEEKIFERELRQTEKELKEGLIHWQLKVKKKDCTFCVIVKTFKEFDIDNSKRTKRRSWCKLCRKHIERCEPPF